MSKDPPLNSPPKRILLGPGPSIVPQRVLDALAMPTIGHLDPCYLEIMDETRGLLREVMLTDNELTVAIPGTGSAGMETAVANLVEPGDRVLVGVNGVFGSRIAEMARRHGAEVDTIEVPWGETIPLEKIESRLAEGSPFKVVALVHAETSTGAHQQIEGVSELVHRHGALLLVDAVTSLAGMEVRTDEWGVDALFSGTQKCLSCPPGLSPVTFSPRAVSALEGRSHPVRSWYLDLSLINNYWGSTRAYHHTAPINMTYALREALLITLEEGLEERIERHRLHHLMLRAGLEALHLKWIPQETLTTLNAVEVPDGIDDGRVRKRLLEEHQIEIGAGLGPLKSRAWRIGLMGASSTVENVHLLLSTLEGILNDEGHPLEEGASRRAAQAIEDQGAAGPSRGGSQALS